MSTSVGFLLPFQTDGTEGHEQWNCNPHLLSQHIWLIMLNSNGHSHAFLQYLTVVEDWKSRKRYWDILRNLLRSPKSELDDLGLLAEQSSSTCLAVSTSIIVVFADAWNSIFKVWKKIILDVFVVILQTFLKWCLHYGINRYKLGPFFTWNISFCASNALA